MVLRMLALFACLSLVKTATAQDAATWKKNGNDLLAAGQFQPALEAFLNAEKTAPIDAGTRTNIGICHYHLHHPMEAEAQLLAAFQAKKEPPPINYLYLAKLQQAQLHFEKAPIFYKQFLRKTPADHPWRPAVRDEIRRCATGLRLRRQSPLAAVLPLADINSNADDFKPLPSPSGQERLYFSANGRSTTATDIFFTEVRAGDWSAPNLLNRFVNGADHEVALGFDEDGANLFFFRGKTLQNGQILVDSFRENPLERTLFFEPFAGPMRPSEGDCEPFFFNDSILVFASRRAGSFGGLDLYVSTQTNGIWSPALNLGPVINSAYDETSPFLSRDGRTLYFSSNATARSMGGLDIQRATYLDWSARWSPPINLGPPINSAADDDHFMLSHGGDRGFFDSDRIIGEGGRDLFVALFDQPCEWQLSESSPVAFCLVAEGKKTLEISERAVQPPGVFFDEISSFELPVMTLPPPGGTPIEQTVNQFALLAQLLKKYPKLEVTVALHSAEGDDAVGAFLFASQTATDLLRQEGVGTERVTLLFAGSSFPVADGAFETNRRAEVFIENPTILPFELRRPPLPPGAFKAEFFQKSMTSLAYWVTVDGGREGVDGKGLAKLFELYPAGLLERRPGQGSLIFSPGLYLTYDSTEEWQRALVLDGYPSATIIPYLRGFALTKEAAARFVDDFPDLQNFIDNEN
ncbi:MAG: hypothetical protein K9J37_12500 [Saprospiraceae bacterium]|nr:hypothetical protein [Saprospiraceae bacterium]MCF8250731.1 hypothetical protein [Saprospiraceae bacterium]MCF8279788.1 hypothetical protein [Bacteroidales bacterium]MCF8310507.1 hypothetical protein [Saprospiraceae bacterium]MCF8440861.1 hypothetical protein [Saprospiraceae bacterium]